MEHGIKGGDNILEILRRFAAAGGQVTAADIRAAVEALRATEREKQGRVVPLSAAACIHPDGSLAPGMYRDADGSLFVVPHPDTDPAVLRMLENDK